VLFRSDTLETLARVLPSLFDILWGDERERAVTIVTLTMPCIIRAVLCQIPSQTEAAANLVQRLCEHPYTMRAWRKDMWDLFHDPLFFTLSINTLLALRLPISSIIAADRSCLVDLISGKGVVQSSSFMFQAKDSEAIQRVRLLRRISFVMFSEDKDEYVEQLPAILEKLSESMKSFEAPMVHSEVLFCMRVVLARVSPDYLASFWPLVLTEATTVLAAAQKKQISSRVEFDLFLAALKFLDLALVLVPEEMAMYRWIFFADSSQMMVDVQVAHAGFVPLLQLLISEADRPSGRTARVRGRAPVLEGVRTGTTYDDLCRVADDLVQGHKFMITLGTLDANKVHSSLVEGFWGTIDQDMHSSTDEVAQ